MTNEQLWWIGFSVIVLSLLALDLGVFNRKPHEVRLKEALLWTTFWVTLAFGFALAIHMMKGPEDAVLFVTGYLVEQSLSMDNVFVIALVFNYFKIPNKYQHKVLFWGILGALVMRAIFIFLGVALINKFTFIIYIFGGFLIFGGIKMFFQSGDQEIEIESTLVMRLLRKIIPVTKDLDGNKFFVVKNGVKYATPLFACLIVVEAFDLVFAVDSIPAILAITSDPFIVYTSNVFAILGLRSLYFAVAGLKDLFAFLHHGLAIILIFVGIKMLIASFFHIPPTISLLVIVFVLASSILASIYHQRKHPKT